MNEFLIIQGLESITNNSSKSVDYNEYQIFCKEFVFETLKGKSFGKAFCERFGFNDYVLSKLSDETAKLHIEKLGYIK